MKHAGDGKAVTSVVSSSTKDMDGYISIGKFFNKPLGECVRSALHEVDGGDGFMSDGVGVQFADLGGVEDFHGFGFAYHTQDSYIGLTISKKGIFDI